MLLSVQSMKPLDFLPQFPLMHSDFLYLFLSKAVDSLVSDPFLVNELKHLGDAHNSIL